MRSSDHTILAFIHASQIAARDVILDEHTAQRVTDIKTSFG